MVLEEKLKDQEPSGCQKQTCKSSVRTFNLKQNFMAMLVFGNMNKMSSLITQLQLEPRPVVQSNTHTELSPPSE